MPKLQRTVTVVHRQGLHARPAALFVQAAKKFASRVTVKKGRKIRMALGGALIRALMS